MTIAVGWDVKQQYKHTKLCEPSVFLFYEYPCDTEIVKVFIVLHILNPNEYQLSHQVFAFIELLN